MNRLWSRRRRRAVKQAGLGGEILINVDDMKIFGKYEGLSQEGMFEVAEAMKAMGQKITKQFHRLLPPSHR